MPRNDIFLYGFEEERGLSTFVRLKNVDDYEYILSDLRKQKWNISELK